MQKAALYVTSFIDVIDAYHQLVYICAVDKTGRALHFLVDRGARAFTDTPDLKSRVRFILYHFSSKCGNVKDMPDDPQFNFNFKLLRQGVDQHQRLPEMKKYMESNKTKIFEAIQPIGADIPEKFSSFAKLVTAVQRYAIRYDKYGPLNNCQHFATGLYNYLTNNKVEYLNKDWMKSIPLNNVSTDPFSMLFQDHTDEQFLALADKLQKLNQKKMRKLKK
jgi:hypothetical protein